MRCIAGIVPGRRFAGHHDCAAPSERIDKGIEYIAAHPEVRDVLLSGGDALLVSDGRLEDIIKRLRQFRMLKLSVSGAVLR